MSQDNSALALQQLKRAMKTLGDLAPNLASVENISAITEPNGHANAVVRLAESFVQAVKPAGKDAEKIIALTNKFIGDMALAQKKIVNLKLHPTESAAKAKKLGIDPVLPNALASMKYNRPM